MQWCALLLFSIVLFILNQMKVSIFYTVFYGIIVHFLITMIFTNSSLFHSFLCYIVFDLCVTCRCSVCNASSGSFSRKYQSRFIGRLGSGGFTLVYLILLGVLIGLTIMIGKQNICLRTKEKLIFIGIALLCVAIEQIDMIAVVRALQQSRITIFHACDNFCLCVIPVYDYAVIYL